LQRFHYVVRGDCRWGTPAWREPGFVEGQNVVIEYRSAEEHFDRLPALVADLMRRPAEVIVGNTPFGARNDDGAKATDG
jgi:hypothetical protein